MAPSLYILKLSLSVSLPPDFHKDKGQEAGATPPFTLQPVWTSKFLANMGRGRKEGRQEK